MISQRKVINQLLAEGYGDFEGGMNTRKFASLCGVSKATAQRDYPPVGPVNSNGCRGYGYEDEEVQFKGPHCVAMNGFSLHCARRVRARDRKGLEGLLMYMARGPIATQRLMRDDDGNLRYTLKRPFSDGRTHVLLSPIEFLEKVAALIPPPWQNQIHYNGVFAPAAAWRDQIVSGLKKKNTDAPDESINGSYRHAIPISGWVISLHGKPQFLETAEPSQVACHLA